MKTVKTGPQQPSRKNCEGGWAYEHEPKYNNGFKGYRSTGTIPNYTGKADSYITFFTYLDKPEQHADDAS